MKVQQILVDCVNVAWAVAFFRKKKVTMIDVHLASLEYIVSLKNI